MSKLKAPDPALVRAVMGFFYQKEYEAGYSRFLDERAAVEASFLEHLHQLAEDMNVRGVPVDLSEKYLAAVREELSYEGKYGRDGEPDNVDVMMRVIELAVEDAMMKREAKAA
jgi:hypothetical protein